MRNEILNEIGCGLPTPSFILDLEILSERMKMLQEAFRDVAKIIYAMKANPWLVAPMKDQCDAFEVCSPGEMRICERNNIPMDKIVLSGVFKEESDIARILDEHHGKGVYTIESPAQLELLQKLAAQRGLVLNILIRVTSGNQFGNDPETVISMYADSDRYENLRFRGIQFYSGTQKRKMTKIEEELAMLNSLIARIGSETGHDVEVLEYGPGLFVSYFERDLRINEAAIIKELGRMLQDLEFKGEITLEMGRFIASTCGYYVTRIVDSKVNVGQRYLIVDGGINHFNYYGQNMAMKIPHFLHLSEVKETEKDAIMTYTVCGSLCTIADVLVREMPLKNPHIGDVLVFQDIGAYSITEGIYMFLSRDLPKIYFYESGKITLVRESYHTDVWNSQAI